MALSFDFMTKSTITITDDGKQVQIEVRNDPLPIGPRETWHIPARTADGMIRNLLERGAEKGLKPAFEVSKNAVTGHIDVTTRLEQQPPNK